MGQLARRTAILTIPATTAVLVAAGETRATATHAEATTVITFTARRVRASPPNVPPAGIPLGTPVVASLALLDASGARIGDGSAQGAVVDVLTGTPPRIVTQENLIFRFPGVGELHTSTLHTRVIPSPDVRHFIAITGGTGDYRTARGSGTFVHVNETDLAIVLNAMVDPRVAPATAR
jgi:hypothetical protein